MKVLLLYGCPRSPSCRAMQGHLPHRGMEEPGVAVHLVHFESAHRVVFENPRVVDYCAGIHGIARRFVRIVMERFGLS